MMIINLRCLVDDEINLFYLQKKALSRARVSLSSSASSSVRPLKSCECVSERAISERQNLTRMPTCPARNGTRNSLLCSKCCVFLLKTCTTRFNRIRAFCEAVFVHELWPLVNNLSHDDGRWALVVSISFRRMLMNFGINHASYDLVVYDPLLSPALLSIECEIKQQDNKLIVNWITRREPMDSSSVILSSSVQWGNNRT